jgi:pyrrolidone-carboxylate peptidase
VESGRDPAARLRGLSELRNGLPDIMVTGYWPPTNDMLRRFSPDPVQNPDGWVGGNWEGLGYDVYAFFPEFPHGLGRGEGDFEVDYQDTSADFWAITEQVAPVAIITTGRTGNTYEWRLEGGHRNYAPGAWVPDYLSPYYPTPELPIANEPYPFDRWSTLPLQRIVDAVILSGANVSPYTTTIDDSAFLCNFVGYHACWYHDLHHDPADPRRVVAAGHIHVGYAMTLADAVIATEASLRALIEYLDEQIVLFTDDFETGGAGAWSVVVP